MHRIRQLADRSLAEAFLLTRDEFVFGLLYRRHKDALWRLAMRLSGGDRNVSEEVLQEAWLRAVERLPQFRWESSLRTWLSGFVVNGMREHWRREKPGEMLEEAISIPARAAPLHKKLDIETAFSSLPPGYRAVLTLHDVEGFKHEEIAGMLGIAVGTSKSQLARARKAVREIMGR
ncbi:MAG: RNA polymerase sigma factor [Lewinellaceae bacterium]|nr:RNA polymerase sigma factor [Saprospiraceae bacterium]MCB9353205.1 RNA polymerase sigma factor [Lewinellaceae bacterium]